MIPRTPAVTYLIAHFLARLRDEDPGNAKLPPRPEKVEKWELRAALAIVLAQIRIEFASFGSRATCDPGLRQRLDAAIDEGLTRTEAVADRLT
jgi:hypothetical protein